MRASFKLQIFASALVVALAAPASYAFAQAPFPATLPQLQLFAAQRVAATNKVLPAGKYTYFTQDDAWAFRDANGWASGYLPGELWATAQLTGDDAFRTLAASRQRWIGALHLSADGTDIGQRYCYSYVKGYEMTGKPAYRAVALAAAACQAARFDPIVGALRSNNSTSSYNVIIDDLMNVQLLTWAADHGGPAEWRDIAHEHALTVARDFIRPDGSTYHVVSYDGNSGVAIEKTTEGFSTDSMWARGQAWGIYGFTDAYRHTRDPQLLSAARRVANRYIADLPADNVPYWNFSDPNIPDAPKDSSAAAIAASGLVDLATLDPQPENRLFYARAARETLAALASPSYLSTSTNPALLLHGTLNNLASMSDQGLSFGDYFFLEALSRLRRLPSATKALSVARVSASARSNAARLVLDGRTSTAWTSIGSQWLQLDLGKARTVSAVGVALWRGDSRSARLRIYASTDKKHWRQVLVARTSGEFSGIETYALTPTWTRYVRVSVAGTTVGSANALSEVRAF